MARSRRCERQRSWSITRRHRRAWRAKSTPRRRRAASRFLDAPVSGGQAGAENGKLTIMVGGDADAFARAEPVLAHLRERGDVHGRPGCGPADQDGQPDLHRRTGAGAVGRDQLRRQSRARRRARARRHRQRRGAILADGQSRQDDGGRPVRLRLRRRLDAQGSRRYVSPKRGTTARRCRSARSSTSSTRASRRAAAGAGTRRA